MKGIEKTVRCKAYGPKSEGVAPPGSLGGGGRLINVGPDALDGIVYELGEGIERMCSEGELGA